MQGIPSADSDVVLSASTKIVDALTASNLQSISPDAGKLVFSHTTPLLTQLKPADVLVFSVTDRTPYGLLRRVIGTKNVGGQVLVDTGPATLDDVIEKGTIEVSGTLKLPSSTPSPVLSDRLVVTQALPPCEGLFIGFDDLKLADIIWLKEAKLCLDSKYTLRIEKTDAGLRVRFTVDVTETVLVRLLVGETATFLNKTFDLKPPDFLQPIVFGIPIPIPPFVLPVVITQVIFYEFGINGKVSIGATTGVAQQLTAKAGFMWDNGQLSPIASLTNTFQFEVPRLTSEVNFKAHVGPKFTWLLYNLQGPFTKFEAYLKLDADPFRQPLWRLFGGLDAHSGMSFGFLRESFPDISMPRVIGFQKLLAQANIPPAASFTASPESGSAPLHVNFNASSSSDPDGSITQYHWDFGDGAAADGITTSHAYNNPGAYTVRLTVTDNKGAASSITKQINVSPALDTQSPALITLFTATDGEDSQSTLTWTNPSDSDLAEVLVNRKTGSYPSNHNDGSDVASCHLTSPSPGTQVSCTDTGLSNGTTYYYAVFSRDGNGNWNDQVCASLNPLCQGKNADTALPQGTTPPPPENQPPSAQFTVSTTTPLVAEAVQFTSTSTDPDPGDFITSHNWDFGDGATATGQTTSHAYPTAGTYQVTLTVTDNHNASSSATKTINVSLGPTPEAPQASFDYTPLNPLVGDQIEFDPTSSSDDQDSLSQLQARWDFDGDGIWDIDFTAGKKASDIVRHTYVSAGAFTVTLELKDTDGLLGKHTDYVTVYAPCATGGPGGPPASSGWPISQHDTRHTGRSPYTGPQTITSNRVLSVPGSSVNFEESSPAIGPEGNIYIGGEDGTLHAFRANGEFLWSFTPPSALLNPVYNLTAAPAIAQDGSIYVPMLLDIQSWDSSPPNPHWITETDAFLVAICPDGTQKWRVGISDLLEVNKQSSPVIDQSGNIYLFDGSEIIIYDSSGNFRGGPLVEGMGRSTPAIDDVTTGHLYFVDSNRLYCWQCTGWPQEGVFVGEPNLGTPAIGNDGTIYVQGSNNLYAWKPDGTQKWGSPLANAGHNGDRSLAPAIDSDGTIYVVHPSQEVIAVSDLGSSGNILWKKTLLGTHVSNVLIDASHTIYVLSASVLEVRRADTGELVDSYGISSSTKSLSLAADGTIYFGSSSGLVAIR